MDALPIGASWWELISARADLTPDRPFISDEAGRVVTFARYRTLAEEVAAGLVECGVGPDDVVSWQLPTTIEAAVLMAALCRLGVRQNPIIPILRRAEVALITAQVHSRFLLVPGVYRGFDYNATALESTAGRDCTVIDVSQFAALPEVGLPRADPATLAPSPVPAADEVRWYYYSSG